MPDRLNRAARQSVHRAVSRSAPRTAHEAFRRACLAGLLVALLVGAVQAPGALAQVPPPAAPGTGRLLYETHCIACHDTQVHWRDGRLAVDWRTLDAQVRRWQANALLNWSEAEIDAVTRYLNASIYRFPRTGERLSGAVPPERGPRPDLPAM